MSDKKAGQVAWLIVLTIALTGVVWAQQYNNGVVPTASTLIGWINGGSGMTPVSDTAPLPVTNAPSTTSVASEVHTTGANEASRVAKASAGVLYGFTVYNASASAQFYLVYNSTTVPVDGTQSAVTPLRCPATTTCSSSTTGGQFPITMSTGIAISNSSTEPTKTIGAADSYFQVFFK